MAFSYILIALKQAGQKITNFAATGISKKRLGPAKESLAVFPSMLVGFDACSKVEVFTNVLSHLRKLRLDLADDEGNLLAPTLPLNQLIGKGGIARFIEPLLQLEDIHIRLKTFTITGTSRSEILISLKSVFGNTTFPRLRRLKLNSFWVEPLEPCEF